MNLPYWLDPLPVPRPPLRGELRVDVAVVGAGLCGASAALHLARSGLRVAVLESRQIAMSATGRNAGFILQGTAERYDRAVALLGRERARRVHAWTVENHERIAAAVAELGIDCEYRRSGSLQLAGSPEEEAELRESARLLAEDGFGAELREELAPVFKAMGARLGVFIPGDGELHPARFVRGVLAGAEALGTTIFEQTPVLALDASTPGDVRLQTPEGELCADAVVLAVNARAAELAPFFQGKVDPVRGQMLATEALPRLFDTPVYANHGFDYWRQDKEGHLVLGGWRNLDPGSETGHDEILNAGIQERMDRFVRAFDWGRPVEITHRWSGIMGFSRDGLPLVGPVPGMAGAVAGVGFTGHGFGFAFMAGAALSALVQEGRHAFTDEFDPRRLL